MLNTRHSNFQLYSFYRKYRTKHTTPKPQNIYTSLDFIYEALNIVKQGTLKQGILTFSYITLKTNLCDLTNSYISYIWNV